MPKFNNIFCNLFLPFLFFAVVSCQHQQQESQSSSSWQSYGQQNPSSEYTMTQRQATSLGTTMMSFLPIFIMIGVGALLLIPIFFLLFTPSMGGFGIQGSSPFGKRSIDGSKQLLELIDFFSSALEKQTKKYGKDA